MVCVNVCALCETTGTRASQHGYRNKRASSGVSPHLPPGLSKVPLIHLLTAECTRLVRPEASGKLSPRSSCPRSTGIIDVPAMPQASVWALGIWAQMTKLAEQTHCPLSRLPSLKMRFSRKTFLEVYKMILKMQHWRKFTLPLRFWDPGIQLWSLPPRQSSNKQKYTQEQN